MVLLLAFYLFPIITIGEEEFFNPTQLDFVFKSSFVEISFP